MNKTPDMFVIAVSALSAKLVEQENKIADLQKENSLLYSEIERLKYETKLQQVKFEE